MHKAGEKYRALIDIAVGMGGQAKMGNKGVKRDVLSSILLARIRIRTNGTQIKACL